MKLKPAMLIALAAAHALGLANAYGQEDGVVQSYQRNFIRSSMSIKVDVLKEAADYEDVDMGPLYLMGIRFALDNAQYLLTDVQLRDIAATSVAGVHASAYAEAVPELWSLFQIFKEPFVRVPILNALADIATGNSQAILNLNTFLYNQNTIRQAGAVPDYQVLDACVVALGKLGSGNSFSVLFTTYTSGYSDLITKHSLEAMGALKGDYKGYLIEVIRKNSSIDKSAALKAAMENAKFTDAEKAEVAESALDTALTYLSNNQTDMQIIRDTRYRAVRELTSRGWSRASALAVKNFNLAYTEYLRGIGNKGALLEAIALLGVMKTGEAALALTLQLQLMNGETDAGKAPDEQIALAVISNLGALGDKQAFEHLLFVSYLAYPETIKSAARDALKKLNL